MPGRKKTESSIAASSSASRSVRSAVEAGPSRTVQEAVVTVAGVVLLVMLGYSIQPVLSPFVLVGAILYLLYPLRQQALAKRIMSLGVILFLVWFFYSTFGLLAPFILAFLLAYICDPLVTRLERRMPRWVSSLLIVLVLLGVAVACALFLMPLAIRQFAGIIATVGTIARDFADFLNSGTVFEFLARFGIPVEKAQEMIKEYITPRLESVLTNLFEGVFGFLSGVSSIVLHVVNAVIIPFLVFYLLMDFPALIDRFVSFVPQGRREMFVARGRRVDELMGRYFRGAITVAILQGVLSAVVLSLIGVKYALVLGIMTAVLNFIPYVGLITSLVVSSIVALFSGDPVLAKVIGVVILYLSQKLLEATVLGPKIIGSQVGLHPVVLILCLLVFGFFLGFVGLLIAVPATALILAGVKEWEMSRSARRGSAPQEA
jgi:predicted PurR-regulated permease PerM